MMHSRKRKRRPKTIIKKNRTPYWHCLTKKMESFSFRLNLLSWVNWSRDLPKSSTIISSMSIVKRLFSRWFSSSYMAKLLYFEIFVLIQVLCCKRETTFQQSCRHPHVLSCPSLFTDLIQDVRILTLIKNSLTTW